MGGELVAALSRTIYDNLLLLKCPHISSFQSREVSLQACNHMYDVHAKIGEERLKECQTIGSQDTSLKSHVK